MRTQRFLNSAQSHSRNPSLYSVCTDNVQASNISNAKSKPVVRVITSGGFAAAYNQLKHQIETKLNIDLHSEYGSSSGGAVDSIPMRLKRGENFDVIMLSRSSLDRLTEQGYVAPNSRIDLVHSKIGMAVQHGATKPHIRSVDAFINALVNAKSIGYSASASGTYLTTVLFPKMGLWDTLKSKSKRILSERVATVVARGEVEIGLQQVSEILPIEGADFVAPIPDKLQKITTFSSGILNNANNRKDAQRLLKYITSVELAPQIATVGLCPAAVASASATSVELMTKYSKWVSMNT